MDFLSLRVCVRFFFPFRVVAPVRTGGPLDGGADGQR